MERLTLRADKFHPLIDVELGRVAVVLGTNGSGKSQLLKKVASDKASYEPKRRRVYVEGARVVSIPSSLKQTNLTIRDYSSLEATTQKHEAQQHDALNKRLLAAFMALHQREQSENRNTIRRIKAWQEAGSHGPMPLIPIAPLQTLFRMFAEIFPELSITLDEKSESIRCKRSGQEDTYTPDALSDGEKQVLALLADLVFLSKHDTLFIVDEPELNLHPILANRVWEFIEQGFPEAVFLYATHSLTFAARPTVESILVLSSIGKQPFLATGIQGVSQDELRPFLGSVAALLSRNRALVVEGQEASFDQIFYSWILGDPSLLVIPLGGSEEVYKAATQTGVWQQMTVGATVFGIQDRDYLSDQSIASTTGGTLLVLDLHEAESYLCVPEVASCLATAVGTTDPAKTKDEIGAMLLAELEQAKLSISLRRTFERCAVRLSVSIERSGMKEITSNEEAIHALKGAAAIELDKAHGGLSPEHAERVFNEEVARCESAISSGDPISILRLLPGKELLNRLATSLGCKNAHAVAVAAKNHLKVDDFPVLRELRKSILDKLPPA